MKIAKHLIAIALCFVSASYGQRQTVMTDTNGNVVFPTNFWNQAPVSTNTQEFIGTNAFGETNGFLQFVTRKHDATYPQQDVWTAMPTAYAGVTPQGRLWIANGNPLTNSNISLAVFSNVANLSQQTNLTITNANAAHGGYRYNAERNVMYASGRNDRVIGINPTNYSVSVVSTNAGAQHRPALIVGNFMYVSKGGSGIGSAEGLAKIDLTTDTQLTNIAVAPTNASTAAIYRMETNPAGTILAGAMTGLSGTNNSVFWTIDLETFTPTITSTNNIIFDVIGANETYAFVSGNPSGAYNLTNHAFTEMGGISYSGVYSTNGNVYFFGDGEIYQYNVNNLNKTTYYTGKFGGTDRLYGMAEIDGKIIAIDGSTNIYELQFVPSVSSQEINISNVISGASLPFVTNVSISNNYPLLNTNKNVYYEITPLETNRNVLNTSLMEQANQTTFPNGYQFTIRNNSTSNNINFLRFQGSTITTIPPQQSKTWVLVNPDSTTFTNRWKQIYSREEMGLGGGVSTNRIFISYDGTNYTTNTVTISNGIITGWTQ
jgi:hypothetical protein